MLSTRKLFKSLQINTKNRMQAYSELILPEFEQEMTNTRKVLECVPNDRLDWKAHPKCNSVGWVANHLAEIPGWVEGTLSQTEWVIDGYQPPRMNSRDEIVAVFDENVAGARRAFLNADHELMAVKWSLVMGGQALMSMPRTEVIRTWVINHTIHHRAHLLVYLRLVDVPVPAMYGSGGNQ